MLQMQPLKTKFTLKPELVKPQRNAARNQAPVALLTQNNYGFQQVQKAQQL